MYAGQAIYELYLGPYLETKVSNLRPLPLLANPDQDPGGPNICCVPFVLLYRLRPRHKRYMYRLSPKP